MGSDAILGRREFAVQAFAVAVVAVSPVFLLGAVAVQALADLGFGPDTLGLLVSGFFLTTSLSSFVVGGLVQGMGGVRGLITATLLSAVSLAGVAVSARMSTLFLVFALGGFANAFAQPAVNLALSEIVNERRLGLTMGIKQASIPLASLAGGLSVPTVALVLGWRWTFGFAAVAALAVAVTLGIRPPPAGLMRPPNPPGEHEKSAVRQKMALLAVAAAFAAASATPLGTFLVAAGVRSGFAADAAALLFSTVSVVGLFSRVGLGLAVDRMPSERSLGLMVLLLCAGSMGYLALAFGGRAVFIVGAFATFGLGWGWAGVFQYAIVAFNPGASATATGMGQVGASMGAALGPLIFGFVSAQWDYHAGWTASAVFALVSAGLFLRSAGRPAPLEES